MIPRPGDDDDDDYADVGFVAQVPTSGPLFVTAGGREVMLARRGDQILAFSGNCTHNFARLSQGEVEGGIVICPVHGARFDWATGKSLSSLCRDLPRLAVRIVGRRVQVKKG